ncbi:hypothetical protein H0H92_007208 [Tricholoma furcatifolium]|nr:hypothetical protein H0H92_007208 [Tricholoma furcatifolium]
MLSRRLIPQLNRTLQSLSRAASSSVPANTQSSTPAAQAPNYPTTWSANQQSRAAATTGARFEQTVMELQPNPLSAMELIANEPVRLVHGRKAVCDGGCTWISCLWVRAKLFLYAERDAEFS